MNRKTFTAFDSQRNIAAGATVVIAYSPQRTFRATGLSYKGPRYSFLVSEIQVGQELSSPGVDVVPAEVFEVVFTDENAAEKYAPHERFSVPIDLPVWVPGYTIQIRVTNITQGALRFILTVFGEVIEPCPACNDTLKVYEMDMEGNHIEIPCMKCS